MTYTKDQLVILFTFFPVLMAALSAAIMFKSASLPIRILCSLIFFALLTESVSRVLWFLKTSNLFLWPIYISVSFGLTLWMYSIVLGNPTLIRLRLGILLAFLTLVLFRTWFGPNQGVIIDNLGLIVESLLVIGLALAYYFKVFQELKIQALWKDPFFWVSTGLFLYYCGNFVFFIFLNYILLYSPKLNSQAWVIHALLNYLLYGIYTIALWISPRK
jgi:nitrate reductase NapE component